MKEECQVFEKNGTTGTVTYMIPAISGLNAGVHEWATFHQDAEHCYGSL
jgi:hypothetical protein